MTDIEQIISEGIKIFNVVKKEATSVIKTIDGLLSDEDIFSDTPRFTFNGNDYVLIVEVPGFSISNLNINIVERGLKVEGSCVINGVAKSKNDIYKIPEAAESEAIEAVLNNGILCITIPKRKVSCLKVDVIGVRV